METCCICDGCGRSHGGPLCSDWVRNISNYYPRDKGTAKIVDVTLQHVLCWSQE